MLGGNLDFTDAMFAGVGIVVAMSLGLIVLMRWATKKDRHGKE